MALKEEVSMQLCINILFLKVVDAFCLAWLVPSHVLPCQAGGGRGVEQKKALS